MCVESCTRATAEFELTGGGPATIQAARAESAEPSASAEVLTPADIQAMMAAMAQIQENMGEMREYRQSERDMRRELHRSQATVRSLRTLVAEPTRRRRCRPAATSPKADDMECSSDASTSHTKDGPDETDD